MSRVSTLSTQLNCQVNNVWSLKSELWNCTAPSPDILVCIPKKTWFLATAPSLMRGIPFHWSKCCVAFLMDRWSIDLFPPQTNLYRLFRRSWWPEAAWNHHHIHHHRDRKLEEKVRNGDYAQCTNHALHLQRLTFCSASNTCPWSHSCLQQLQRCLLQLPLQHSTTSRHALASGYLCHSSRKAHWIPLRKFLSKFLAPVCWYHRNVDGWLRIQLEAKASPSWKRASNSPAIPE